MMIYRQTPRRLAALALCLVTLLTGTALAAGSDAGTFADQLATLRAEVEALSAQVEDKKAELRSRLRSASSQQADVELQIQREELRLQQLRQARERQQERTAAARAAQAELEPQVLESIATLRAGIADGLPFKITERLAELDKLEAQVKDGTLTPHRATARLWQIAEDNLRLTRENGLYRQVITVDGEEMLADVARIGMVAMYFSAGDGRVGMTTRNGDAWTYQVLTDREDQRRVVELFDAFKKQIRVGAFEVPNALTTGGR